jgi:hypothetical protein
MKKSIVFAVLLIAILSTSAYSQMQLSTEPFWTFFFDIWTGQHDVKTPNLGAGPPSGTAAINLAVGNGRLSLER